MTHSPSCVARRAALVESLRCRYLRKCQECQKRILDTLTLSCSCAELLALRRVVEAAQERIECLIDMTTCYRLGRRPNDSKLHRWDAARSKYDDAIAALPTEGG